MEKMNFKIYEPKQSKAENAKLANKLFGHSPRIVLVGASGSGKTQFILNYLFNFQKKYLKKNKTDVLVMTTTHDTAEQIEELADENGFDYRHFKIYTYLDLDLIEEEYNKSNKSFLLILDDCAFKKEMNTKNKPNIISEIYTSGRHKNAGVIIASQKYFYLGEDVRSLNANFVVIYSTLSQKEVDRIYEENISTMMNYEDFLKIIKEHLGKEYGFIVIDKKRKKLYDTEFKEINRN